ncbi:MAG: hypothetical protein EBY21_01010 [Alphaproteobacteria bacterium]|nr:hypothetical protein [Alphaproteobacteria bacterium]
MLHITRKILTPLLISVTLAGPFMVNPAMADRLAYRRPASGWNNAGPAIAGGLVAGLALGALAAQYHRPAPHYPAHRYRPHYYAPRPVACRLIQRPAYDHWGYFIGYRTFRVCD